MCLRTREMLDLYFKIWRFGHISQQSTMYASLVVPLGSIAEKQRNSSNPSDFTGLKSGGQENCLAENSSALRLHRLSLKSHRCCCWMSRFHRSINGIKNLYTSWFARCRRLWPDQRFT